MKTIYYMPVFLKEQAIKTQEEKLLKFCEIFKVVSPNTCLIDRIGGVLDAPFDFEALDPIPAFTGKYTGKDYNNLCIERAQDILKENKNITIFYSGGLDSTVVLLSFYLAIKDGIGSFDQITVSTTPFAIIENPEVWTKVLLPHFKLISVNDGIKIMGDKERPYERFVMGENADQLFGSDIVLANMNLFDFKINSDSINNFLKMKNVSPSLMDYLHDVFSKLNEKCPTELNTMADLIWWLNFSCKWQSVSLRALCFSDFLNTSTYRKDLQRFETFFNTQKFQELSLYGELPKWGKNPSHYNYKLASRIFLKQFRFLEDYANTKIKVPSLYRVLTTESYRYNVIALDGDKLVSTDTIKLKDEQL